MTNDFPVPPPWAEGEMIGYDLETTGIDVETDRVVSAVVVHVLPGHDPVVWKWLADPGVDIPQSAAEVHGITTEHARHHGGDAAVVLTEIRDRLEVLWRPGVPLVGHNPTYDLTLTDREFGRHLGDHLTLRGPVVDTLTIDRQWWKYLRGKGMRKLTVTHERYGLGVLEGAHDAEADATAALRLAWAMSRRYPAEVGLVDPGVLHDRQRDWYRDWAVGFGRRYLTRLINTLERGRRFGLPKVMASVLGPDVEPTPENVDAALGDLRARRAAVLAGAEHWPLIPRPARCAA